jgi:hypothetical protein
MTDEQNQPKQKTPKGHEIPVPKRKSIFDAFRKVAAPEPDSTRRGSKQ